jgi:protease-4
VQDSGKPVVAAIGSVGASGGYYAALAAQEIWIQPGSLTGSIGVIYERWDVSALATKLGVSRDAMTAGAYKDVGSLWRPPTTAETKMMRAMLTDVYQQFVDVVRLRRGIDASALPSVAEGRVWTGRQAVSLGLADRLGSWQSAARRAADLAGLPPDTPIKEVYADDWIDAIRHTFGTTSMAHLAALGSPQAAGEPWPLPRWQWAGGPPVPAGIQIW